MTPERVAQLRSDYDPDKTYCNRKAALAVAEVLDALATERARAEAAEGREARLREAGEILLNRARHRGCCASTRAGMACDCGLSEARAALAGTPEGEQG